MENFGIYGNTAFRWASSSSAEGFVSSCHSL